MHKLLTKVMQSYLVPKYELPLMKILTQGTYKVIRALVGCFEKLCKVNDDKEFHIEITYYDPLIITLFDCLDKVDTQSKDISYVLESLLQYREDAFPITKIPNFCKMLSKYNDNKDIDKIGQFSKVICLLVLDRQKKNFTKTFEKQYPLRLFPSSRLIDLNE